MKNKVLIIALSLALFLSVGTSCNISEQYNEMQSQNQLNIYTPTNPSADSKDPTEDSTIVDPSEKNEDSTIVEPSEDTTIADPSEKTENSTNADPSEKGEDNTNEEAPAVRTEPKAPDFTVYDASGNAVKLSDYLGKPVVLNFWASWCGPCQSEMPAFNQKYLEYDGEVQFLMVNLTSGRETVSSASNFISKKGYTFPVFFDTSNSASDAYSVYSIPATYFIDADGYIIANAIGAISASVLQQGIDLIK